jgi:thiol-disulfide isomerase/thioredoxin
MSDIKKSIITDFSNREEFLQLLKLNPGLIIMKLGASWCKPCKTIAPVVDAFFATSPPNVICCDIDVDNSIDLYSFLKMKKMVYGIPVLMCYTKGNHIFAPNDMVTGTDPAQLDAFFKRCGQLLKQVGQMS